MPESVGNALEAAGKAEQGFGQLFSNFLPAYAAVLLWNFFTQPVWDPNVLISTIILASVGGLALTALEGNILPILVRFEKFVTRIPEAPTHLKAAEKEDVWNQEYKETLIPQVRASVHEFRVNRQYEKSLGRDITSKEKRILNYTYFALVCEGFVFARCLFLVSNLFHCGSASNFWEQLAVVVDPLREGAVILLFLASIAFILGARHELNGYRKVLSNLVPIIKILMHPVFPMEPPVTIKRRLDYLEELAKVKQISTATYDELKSKFSEALLESERLTTEQEWINSEIIREIDPKITREALAQMSQETADHFRRMFDIRPWRRKGKPRA